MIYFLHGDTPLQMRYQELIKEIKSKNLNIPEKIYDASLGEETDFLGSISTNSMFSPKELIILKRSESLKKLDKFIGYLEEYDLSQKEVVIVYEEFLNSFGKATNKPTTKMFSNIEKVAKLVTARKENEKKGMIFFVEKELKISEYDAEKICEIIGEDFYTIKQEVEKVKNFLNGEPFSLEKILPILSVSNEFNLKNLIDNFIENKEKINLINYLREEKEYMSFLYMISDEMNIILKLKLLEKRGSIKRSMSYKYFKENIYEGIKKYFKKERGDYVKEYPLFLKIKLLELYDEEFLKEMIKKLIYSEFNIKSGHMPDAVEIEKLILEF